LFRDMEVPSMFRAFKTVNKRYGLQLQAVK